ncbi:nitrogen regulation protein NR(II) [Hydrocarboniclastica marina]|uniref:Sensory histidine kinase/phosphatase NtrB n=1 Tax=Hydrocarboniclastica marina TaxID=2259620 RepID=A0A4P7XDQ6_9ALTE|nr:nitrogen regulation protein NR(II) [Hydrocarboniclastica marina]MAL99590.1 nitrogen regulation protein NR(II) [Alteromonadaceae bacterium]QCF25001.1 nitrogen regulation protein NR(II) [Hydrocarboniclastica marina]
MKRAPFFKRMLENLSTAVLLLDRRLRVIYINPAAEMLFEVSGKRIQDAPVTDLFIETDEALQTLQESVVSGHPFTRREAEFMLSSGTRVRADYSISPFPDDAAALLMEIQPRDRLLRITREEELLHQQETTRILVRGMAHEIKNPLGGIRGAAQLLDRELDSQGLKDYTRVIIEEADRLRALVDRMLGPNKAPQMASANIHEVLERVRTLLEAESKGTVQFARDYDVSLPEFLGDKAQLIQAFLNVARNALEALAHQKPPAHEPRILFRTRALRQFTIGQNRHRLVVRVDIIDNGPGIPADLLQNVFYPMISGRANGTGLGLAITQSIIGQHHGLVECESSPGRTNFIIFIPLEPPA